jgi:hypothetical protein
MSGFDFAVESDVKGEKRQRIGKVSDMEVYSYQRYGAAGYGAYSAGRHIPRPYPASKFVWGPEKDIARLPSVQARDIVTGPERTVHASEISIYSDVMNRSVGERTQKIEAPVPIRLVPQEPSPQLGLPMIQEFLMGPSRKHRIDSLRNVPFMGQGSIDLPILKSLPIFRAFRRR